MNELNASGEVDVAAAGVAAEPGAGEGEEWAKPFASGRHDMRGELRDERDRTVHTGGNGAVAGAQIVLKQADQRAESIGIGRAMRTRTLRGRRASSGRAGEDVHAGR